MKETHQGFLSRSIKHNFELFRLYVNSWGRSKKQKSQSCRSESSGTILCMAEENPVSEIAEVAHSKANSFQDFRFVVAALNKSI